MDLRQATGEVVFTFEKGDGSGEITRTLRRPKLKEYRTLVEAVGAMRDDVATDDAAEMTTRDINKGMTRLLEWFQLVFSTLSGEALPPEDDLPAWLIGGDVTRDLIAHWQATPSRRGGR